MDEERLRRLIDALQRGEVTAAEALAELRRLPFADLGFAKVDHHRALRTGSAEAILCQGKTVEQVVAIAERLARAHSNVLVTRAPHEIFVAIQAAGLPAEYHPKARVVVVNPKPQEGVGLIAVVSAGTADQAVADEAAVTCEALGNRVERIYDVGVAGLHRVLDHYPLMQEANVIIVVAGMEGALPSVVGGLVDRPVIAVPTSVGYGASLGGIAALLAMLNSCAPGVSVVNIDNGFGAAQQANLINKLIAKIR
ncbi:MAG: nickel pincer cofactor biosynthesis protein LarB [Candidatus Rokubacteria bacterium]|nr:nickel pincer cofactor biosynthesis protein LarB [Candidatus Rokubacteria bacterium]